MIQRIQSIYLFVAGLALLAIFPFEILWAGNAASEYVWFTPGVLFLSGLGGVGAIVSIFLFNNRSKQLRLVSMAKYVTLGVLVVLYLGFWLGDEFMVADGQGILWGRLLPLVFPVISYICLFLAQRAIRADIELVRSMDRLR